MILYFFLERAILLVAEYIPENKISPVETGDNIRSQLNDKNVAGYQSISIVDEMQRSYLDYAMSVVVSRALPDVRDGLKPVHRRILYAMHKMGLDSSKDYRKSAGVVGEVMGKFHPHGDASIYDALVRMTQDFSMGAPLIDGQGNFGSIDGDRPAAMRYTECRLEKISSVLLADIEKETVPFQANYDSREREPIVLPASYPNLLVNGAGGIAVGMATNIPPHNLNEVIAGCLELIDNPKTELNRLLELIPGPDFPTGGQILGHSGIRLTYEKGYGSILIRGKVNIDTLVGGRQAIIITEIPYQVNKATMVEKIAELVRDKRIEDITDIRDESDRHGYRVVIELRRDAVADVVLNQLYRFTTLQTSFSCNIVVLSDGKPLQMNLIDLLNAFISFREEIVTRRIKYLLHRARNRAHILVGLAIAVANIDEIIVLIRSASDSLTARSKLMERRWLAKDMGPLVTLIDDPRYHLSDEDTYLLSEEQARSILDLRLQRLTALGGDEIADELNDIGIEIRDYLDILSSRIRIQSIIKDELIAVRNQFGMPRKTEIIDCVFDVDDEDLIAKEEMVITVSHSSYVKRVPLVAYRSQKRGGKGRSGMSTKDKDFVTHLFIANTHTSVLFLSSRGLVYKLKVWKLPLALPHAKGKSLINFLPLEPGENMTTIMPLPEDENSWENRDVLFATKSGKVRRNKLSDFTTINKNGKIAMKLEDHDEIVNVATCSVHDDVLLTTAMGQAIRFTVSDVRVFSCRHSVGVRGIQLGKNDHVISMAIIQHFDANASERITYLKQGDLNLHNLNLEEDIASVSAKEVKKTEYDINMERLSAMKTSEQFILTITEKGFGKRSSSYDFRVSNRGGKGVKIIDQSKISEIGCLVSAFPVDDTDQIMLVSNTGQLIRVPVDNIRIASRISKGVRVFRTTGGENVVSVEKIHDSDL